MSAEAQRGEAQHGTGAGRQDNPDRERAQERQPESRGAEGDAIGADPEKGRLGQVDLSGVAEHDRQPQYRDRVCGGLHQEIERIGGERGDERRHDSCERGRRIKSEGEPPPPDHTGR